MAQIFFLKSVIVMHMIIPCQSPLKKFYLTSWAKSMYDRQAVEGEKN